MVIRLAMTSRRDPAYGSLMQYLRALPSDAAGVVLELDAIAALLGGTLPVSAHLTNFWATSIIATETWNRAGFDATLEWERGRVQFQRR